MRENWKLWLTGLVVVVGLGFAIHRIRSSFSDQPPAWLHPREISTPKLSGDLATEILAFHKELDGEAKATGLALESMHLVEVADGGKEVRTWHLEHLNNPGPAPLTNFEINRTLTENRLVGVYTLDGAPLNLLLRHMPSHPKAVVGVITFDQPVAPGVPLAVLSVEHQPSNLRTNAAGELTYQFNRWRNADNSIQVVGVILPPNYSILRYAPMTGSFTATNGTPLVFWINTRVEAGSPPPSVAFKPM